MIKLWSGCKKKIFFIIQKVKKAAEGYPDNARVLFQTRPVTDFVMEDNHLSILQDTNQLVFDRTSEVFSRHPLTTEEIRESCRDIKVLGPKELKGLVKWREKMKAFLEEVEESEGEGEGAGRDKMEEGEDEELIEIDGKVKDLAAKEAADVKRLVEHDCCMTAMHMPYSIYFSANIKTLTIIYVLILCHEVVSSWFIG